jgi:hypothetical protein
MAQYTFLTTWQFDAPREAVWDKLVHPEDWPGWWKYVAQTVQLERGGEDGVGALWRYTWTGRLPYRLSFDMRTTLVERLRAIEGQAKGELEGTGRWHLSGEGRITTVRYEWSVRTTKAWMNLVAPLARPAFAWNHDAIMREGGEGLARALNARLVDSLNVSLPEPLLAPNP